MLIRSLFDKYQPELVKLANLDSGRKFLGIGHEVKSREWISRIFPNGYSIQIGRRKQRSVFRCYPLFAKKLQSVISQVEITRNEKLYQKLGRYKGLLHYSGLFEQPRLYPQIFLASGDPIYAGAGDGYFDLNNANWATLRGASTATFAGSTAPSGVHDAEYYSGDGNYYMRRCFFPVDTSGLGAGADISAATFSVYPTGAGDNTEATNPADLTLVSCTKSTAESTYASGDYDSGTTTKISDTTVDLGTFIGSGAGGSSWAFNGTGLGYIADTAITHIPIRAANDYDDAHAPSARSYGNLYFSEQTGTDTDPKLVVTYTPAPVGIPLGDKNQPIFLKPKVISY